MSEQQVINLLSLKQRLKAVYRFLIAPVEPVYFRARQYLPVFREIRYANIIICEVKPLDRFFPRTRDFYFERQNPDIDDYEEALVGALNEHVKPGDRVVVVGGGYGVTACVAAKRAGTSGSVICYEGSLQSCTRVLHSATLNKLDSIITVVEAIVSADVGVYTGEKAARIIDPALLPQCEVLQLDCEGAEIDILQKMQVRPRVVIVETHGFLGASTQAVEAVLSARGYSVRNAGVAEPRLRSICEKNDVYCLVAHHKH